MFPRREPAVPKKPPLSPREKIAVKASEAAELLSMDRTTFYRKVMPHVRAGDIRSIHLNGVQRILVDSLLAWAASQGGAA